MPVSKLYFLQRKQLECETFPIFSRLLKETCYGPRSGAPNTWNKNMCLTLCILCCCWSRDCTKRTNVAQRRVNDNINIANTNRRSARVKGWWSNNEIRAAATRERCHSQRELKEPIIDDVRKAVAKIQLFASDTSEMKLYHCNKIFNWKLYGTINNHHPFYLQFIKRYLQLIEDFHQLTRHMYDLELCCKNLCGGQIGVNSQLLMIVKVDPQMN